MRGKVGNVEPVGLDDRITPAYAGKSGLIFGAQLVDRDHPRICGEKDYSRALL